MDMNLVVNVVLGFVTMISIVVAVRLARRKKPVWAYSNAEIIELRKGTPPELKLLYNDKQVTGVFRTLFIFFNRGRQAIKKEDVRKSITVDFAGAQILHVPTVRPSNDDIGFSMKMINGNSAIEVDFQCLDHNDGVLLQVLHTKCDKPVCTGYILEAGEPKYIGKFAQRPRRDLSGDIITAFYTLFVPALVVWTFFIRLPRTPSEWFLYVITAVGWIVLSLLQLVIPRFRYVRFPSWSTTRDKRMLLGHLRKTKKAR
jgi:hypothetical protein